MTKNLLVEVTTEVQAPPDEVWTALTTPEMIKQYLFGTNAMSEWKVGSPIYYRGVWEGKEYEDKGIILQFVPEKIFESSYWSPAYGLPDTPENYKKVTYTLKQTPQGTKLTLTQDNNATEVDRDHSKANWTMVLGGLKKLVETGSAK